MTVAATPLSYRKSFEPLVPHRPDMFYRVPSTGEVCASFGYGYLEADRIEDADIPDGAPVLVCGAGILPGGFIGSHRVINAHPGVIPFSRGLDALKWALLEGAPVGATAHLIGDEVDAGEVIERREVEIRPGDTVLSLGLRVYAEEVDMLVGALELLDELHERVVGGDGPVHRRMPREKELEMLERFEERKRCLEDGV